MPEMQWRDYKQTKDYRARIYSPAHIGGYKTGINRLILNSVF